MQTLLIESAIRATLIAAVIGLVLFAMRIKTASVLHAVWASVVVLMMLLPAWVAWGPKASLPVLPSRVRRPRAIHDAGRWTFPPLCRSIKAKAAERHDRVDWALWNLPDRGFASCYCGSPSAPSARTG